MGTLRIIADAGHWYNTPGKRSAPFVKTTRHIYGPFDVTVKKGEQFKEHTANVGVAYFFASEMERLGIEVIKSGWKDKDATKNNGPTNPSADVVARQRALDPKKADYSVSFHFNAYGNGQTFNSGQGCETLYHSISSRVGEGKALAVAIQNRLKTTFPKQKNRGVIGGSHWGMCNSQALGVKGAVIVELGFMTNQFEAENYFCNPQAWFLYSKNIALGMVDYITGGTPKLPITKLSSKKHVMWLQIMLNKAISDGKIKNTPLLMVDGLYGRNTALAYKAFAEYMKWNKPLGWYVGTNGIKALES